MSDATLYRTNASICGYCLDGQGQECHTPGCAFYLCATPKTDLGTLRSRFEIFGTEPVRAPSEERDEFGMPLDGMPNYQRALSVIGNMQREIERLRERGARDETVLIEAWERARRSAFATRHHPDRGGWCALCLTNMRNGHDAECPVRIMDEAVASYAPPPSTTGPGDWLRLRDALAKRLEDEANEYSADEDAHVGLHRAVELLRTTGMVKLAFGDAGSTTGRPTDIAKALIAAAEQIEETCDEDDQTGVDFACGTLRALADDYTSGAPSAGRPAGEVERLRAALEYAKGEVRALAACEDDAEAACSRIDAAAPERAQHYGDPLRDSLHHMLVKLTEWYAFSGCNAEGGLEAECCCPVHEMWRGVEELLQRSKPNAPLAFDAPEVQSAESMLREALGYARAFIEDEARARVDQGQNNQAMKVLMLIDECPALATGWKTYSQRQMARVGGILVRRDRLIYDIDQLVEHGLQEGSEPTDWHMALSDLRRLLETAKQQGASAHPEAPATTVSEAMSLFEWVRWELWRVNPSGGKLLGYIIDRIDATLAKYVYGDGHDVDPHEFNDGGPEPRAFSRRWRNEAERVARVGGNISRKLLTMLLAEVDGNARIASVSSSDRKAIADEIRRFHERPDTEQLHSLRGWLNAIAEHVEGMPPASSDERVDGRPIREGWWESRTGAIGSGGFAIDVDATSVRVAQGTQGITVPLDVMMVSLRLSSREPTPAEAALRLLDRDIAWHQREARACETNIAGLGGRGMAPHRAINEGALKIHRIATVHLQQIRSALDGSATEPVSELRDCTCSDVRSGDSRCRGVGSLGDGWRCVKLGRGPTPEERAESQRLLDEYAAKMTDHATFIERCLRDEVDSPYSAIDDEVSAWHEGNSGQELHEYLGMTQDEYNAWVLEPSALTAILDERRKKG